MSKPTLFNVLDNITQTNDDRWNEYQSVYVPFLINRFLSMHPETVGFANLMNKSKLEKKEQYYFYLYSIPNKKRYFRYIKENKSKTTQIISDYYKINKNISKSYSKLLSKKQVKDIEKEITPNN